MKDSPFDLDADRSHAGHGSSRLGELDVDRDLGDGGRMTRPLATLPHDCSQRTG